eukprot:4932557-Alexandrium_andersonii.AAC.1
MPDRPARVRVAGRGPDLHILAPGLELRARARPAVLHGGRRHRVEQLALLRPGPALRGSAEALLVRRGEPHPGVRPEPL